MTKALAGFGAGGGGGGAGKKSALPPDQALDQPAPSPALGLDKGSQAFTD